MSYRLIITAPGQEDLGTFASEWGRLLNVLRRYVNCYGNYDIYRDFLSSGLPYHLPFSFDSSTARLFATDLRNAGCQVLIVSAGDEPLLD